MGQAYGPGGRGSVAPQTERRAPFAEIGSDMTAIGYRSEVFAPDRNALALTPRANKQWVNPPRDRQSPCSAA